MSKSIQAVTGLVNQRSWWPLEGDSYLVTGVDRRGKRFAVRSTSWFHARGINLWHGSRWLVRDGRKILLTRV